MRRPLAFAALLGAVLTTGAADATPTSHPSHASAGEARFDPERNVVETSVQLDAQHLAEALSRFAARPVAPERESDDPAVRAILADYLRARVAVRTPAGPANLRLVGFESAGFDAWLHFEVLLPPGAAGEALELRQLLLREHLERQENLLAVHVGAAHDVARFGPDRDDWFRCGALLPERTNAAPLLPLGRREDWRMAACIGADAAGAPTAPITLRLGAPCATGCAEIRLASPADGAAAALAIGAGRVRFVVVDEAVTVELADGDGVATARLARPATLGATPRGDVVCAVEWSPDGIRASVDAIDVAARPTALVADAAALTIDGAALRHARAWRPRDAR